MSLRDRLVRFVEQKLRDSEKQVPGGLDDETSLVASGLLESIVLLDLAAWIEDELGCELDLTRVDLPDAWDDIGAILDFIETSRAAARD